MTVRITWNSVEPKPLRYSILLARPNLFPSEVRPLTRFLAYKQSYPQPLVLQSALLRYLALQDSVPVLDNLPLGATDIGGFYSINFDKVFANPLDEGFVFSTKLTWLTDCNFSEPDSSKQIIKFEYPNCFYPESIFEKTLQLQNCAE